MKSLVLKVSLIINLLFIYNCKAQTATTSDYIAFYNDIAPKLNSIVPNKTQFYGQNFSNFYNELQNKNIDIISLNYDTKINPGTKYYILNLFLTNMKMWSIASDNDYQLLCISITFENKIPKQIETLAEQNNMQWTYNIQQFFANMKIEKIEFIGLNGYDSTDNSLK
ncbi:hypothetical protein GCM10023210_33030 [Chryseobacterium ginsengisoli]|uniref:Uncharacterized protein n=1 Tax=Chryseobacterium ginsengisoli TaxID=363853 RepID=A0ABP9MJK7_9FLAO